MAAYADRLRALMDKHGIRSAAELSRRTGVDISSCKLYLRGIREPSYPTSLRLAEILGDAAGVSAPTATCQLKGCGNTFRQVVVKGRKRRYCSRRCTQLAWERRRHGYPPSEAANLALRRLPIYQEAINRHCNWCEPDGICKTANCAIQEAGISPLPLQPATLRVAC